MRQSQTFIVQVVYESYGPAATGFVIECLTDNLNRSANAVRSAVQKSGGKMAEKGSVMFNFNRRGLVFVTDPSAEDKVSGLQREGHFGLQTIWQSVDQPQSGWHCRSLKPQRMQEQMTSSQPWWMTCKLASR